MSDERDLQQLLQDSEYSAIDECMKGFIDKLDLELYNQHHLIEKVRKIRRKLKSDNKYI